MIEAESQMAEAASYEEQRRRQVEANKRKLEELRLHHLSAAVRESAAKPSPVKQRKRKARAPPGAGEDAPLRRSGRVANLPEKPKYRDEFQDFEKRIRRSYGGKRRDLSNRVYATEEQRDYAINAAQELEEELGSDYPIFVKPMLQSHVTGGFWLSLPTHFSRKYLPKRDETIRLVDEEDDEFDTLYLANKRGLSGGWRGFSIAHKLVDGDCLVFQLIQRTKFKVYIIRASSYYETDD
ncbi:B3 domain-containing protein Os06g0194400 [Oryza glaberrima]|uniref:TF-B3 domain-containing protein n=1 Tax=Oryza glaberrima TaxID=4538 RepID=I1Q094_ORYGL|nr:B3 domain-containing protein Os06g0194400 [Oryza glaberrima]